MQNVSGTMPKITNGIPNESDLTGTASNAILCIFLRKTLGITVGKIQNIAESGSVVPRQ